MNCTTSHAESALEKENFENLTKFAFMNNLNLMSSKKESFPVTVKIETSDVKLVNVKQPTNYCNPQVNYSNEICDDSLSPPAESASPLEPEVEIIEPLDLSMNSKKFCSEKYFNKFGPFVYL